MESDLVDIFEDPLDSTLLGATHFNLHKSADSAESTPDSYFKQYYCLQQSV